MALDFPDPSESPWMDENGRLWVHDGDGWICAAAAPPSRPPKVSVYSNQTVTHTFDMNAAWAKVIVTGGGQTASGNNAGGGGATAIKSFMIETPTANIVAAGTAGTSTYNDGINSLSGGGGNATGATASGGDINIRGGGGAYAGGGTNAGSVGGGSYWGGGGKENNPAVVYGAGGGQYNASQYGAGAAGVVYIEEHY